jgi:hypothetical protein
VAQARIASAAAAAGAGEWRGGNLGKRLHGLWVAGEEAGQLRVWPIKEKGKEFRILFNLFSIHRKKIKSKEIARCL